MSSSKLKPPGFLIITAVLIAAAGISILIFSEMGIFDKTSLRIYELIVFSHASFENAILLFRSKNKAFIPVVTLYLIVVCASLQALFIVSETVIMALVILAVPLVPIVIYVYAAKKISFRQRKVLETAARPVNETADGFTPRPLSAGEIKFTRQEIADFSKYLIKNLIAMYYFEEDKVYLLIDPNELTYARLFKPKYQNQTYVSFDYSGKVSVNIAAKDYKKYKEEYTFDELCQSLGNLFKRFLEYHQQGKKEEILEELDNKK